MTVLGIAVTGALAATLRHLVHTKVAARWRSPFPLGTLIVNVAGSLMAGVVAGLVLAEGIAEVSQILAAVGFLGAFTTFSTFAYESVTLAEGGHRRALILNVALSIASTTLAAAAGIALGRLAA